MRNFIPKKISGFRSKSINALIDCVTMLYPLATPSIRREFTTHGVKLNALVEDVGVDDSWSLHTSISVKTVTTRPGHVNIWNLKSHAVNGGDIDTSITTVYSGTSEYIWACVKIPLDSSGTPTIEILAAYPTPDSTYIHWPLARFRTDDSGYSYTTDGNDYILHRGDINLVGPIAWA